MKASELEQIARSALQQHAPYIVDREARYKNYRKYLLAWKTRPAGGPQLEACKFFIGVTIRFAAADDPSARKACLETAAEFLVDGAELPWPLAYFVADLCRETAQKRKKRSKAQSVYSNIDRNNAICSAAAALIAAAPTLPMGKGTRGRLLAKMSESVSGIVAKVLPEFGIHLDPTSVETIYRKFNDLDWDNPPFPYIRN